MSIKESIPRDSHMGGCGVVRFYCGTRCRIKRLPLDSHVPSLSAQPWKNFSQVFIRLRNSSSSRHFAPLVQSMSSQLYYSWHFAQTHAWSMWLSGHRRLLGHIVAMERENGRINGASVCCTERERNRETERGILC